jgi:hypothetical protein
MTHPPFEKAYDCALVFLTTLRTSVPVPVKTQKEKKAVT